MQFKNIKNLVSNIQAQNKKSEDSEVIKQLLENYSNLNDEQKQEAINALTPQEVVETPVVEEQPNPLQEEIQQQVENQKPVLNSVPEQVQQNNFHQEFTEEYAHEVVMSMAGKPEEMKQWYQENIVNLHNLMRNKLEEKGVL